MPVNTALLAVFQSLFAVQEAIVLIQLALNDNPTPSDRLALEDQLTDLQTTKDALVRTRDQLKSGAVTIEPPGDDLLKEIGALTAKVEKATTDGVAASAALELAGDVLELGISVMSLAK